jgi:hypothetical protein
MRMALSDPIKEIFYDVRSSKVVTVVMLWLDQQNPPFTPADH